MWIFFNLISFFISPVCEHATNSSIKHRQLTSPQPTHLVTANTENLTLQTLTSKPSQILKYSHYLGIEEITIFAFSIENFKRDPAETELLMSLATEKFSALLAEREELAKNDVCIRFIGDLTLLPVKLQKLIAELMLLTKDHKAKCLNVCMAYTSSYELSSAANKLYNAVNQNVLSDEITLEHLSACLLTNRSRTDPEMLIRQVFEDASV